MEKLEIIPETISKSEYVYQTLQEQILSGAFPPGMPLFIREISAQLDVSRTPVKEAIGRLTYDGYVELLPNRCAIVARISASEIMDLLEVREALEGSAAFYAAQRRTEEDIEEFIGISEGFFPQSAQRRELFRCGAINNHNRPPKDVPSILTPCGGGDSSALLCAVLRCPCLPRD